MESSSSLSTVPRNDEGIPVKRSLYFCIAAAACTAFTATTALAARVHPSEPRTTATIPPSSSFSARIDNQWSTVLTQETTPLEPGTVDRKMYVRGIGTVLEQTEQGPNERNELVSVTRGK